MGVPSKPLPALAELNVTADPKTRDVMAELQSILTGNVDRNNLKDAETTKVKLAADALNAFLKLAVAADRKVVWGSSDNGGASWGLAADRAFSIAHGQGVAPQWWIAWGTVAVSTASAQDPTVVSRIGEDATNLTVKQSTVLRGTCNFPGATVYWLGIF